MTDEQDITLEDDSFHLAIKLSHRTALPCLLCGGLTESFTGSDLFLAELPALIERLS